MVDDVVFWVDADVLFVVDVEVVFFVDVDVVFLVDVDVVWVDVCGNLLLSTAIWPFARVEVLDSDFFSQHSPSW